MISDLKIPFKRVHVKLYSDHNVTRFKKCLYNCILADSNGLHGLTGKTYNDLLTMLCR